MHVSSTLSHGNVMGLRLDSHFILGSPRFDGLSR